MFFQNAIIATVMLKNAKGSLNLSNASDLAFAIVVLTSYFITFTEIIEVSGIKIIAMIGLGVTYITLGIYGFGYFRDKNDNSWTLFYFAIQICFASVIIYLSHNSGLIALILFPLIGQSVTIQYSKSVFIVNLVISLSYILSLGLGMQSVEILWNVVPTFIIGQILIITFIQMVMAEQNSRKELEKAAEELSKANDRLREYANQVEELATSKERNRLAREIHDGLGHYLTTIFMQIEATNLLITKNPNEASSSLEKAGELTKAALEDVRRSVETLRIGKEEIKSLPDRISKLFENINSENINIEFNVLGKHRKISTQGELTLFRSVQEMINNTIKHAKATHISASLIYSKNCQNVILNYEDDGIGSKNPIGGFGLTGMRERVKLLNGRIDIITQVDRGFRIRIEIPG